MLEVLATFTSAERFFSWCRKQKADLIFLQETHSTAERQDQWQKEWGASVLFSHGSTNARGVAILIRNGLNITIQLSEISSDGRFIVIKAAINNEIIIHNCKYIHCMVQTKTPKLLNFIVIYQNC